MFKVGKTPTALHFPICYRSVWTKAQIICMNTTGKRPSKAEGLSASTWKGFVQIWQAGLEKAISLQQRFPLEMVLSEKLSEHMLNWMLAAYTHTTSSTTCKMTFSLASTTTWIRYLPEDFTGWIQAFEVSVYSWDCSTVFSNHVRNTLEYFGCPPSFPYSTRLCLLQVMMLTSHRIL